MALSSIIGPMDRQERPHRFDLCPAARRLLRGGTRLSGLIPHEDAALEPIPLQVKRGLYCNRQEKVVKTCGKGGFFD
jgi:hypothetical protein